jgi:hypothetical protein
MAKEIDNEEYLDMGVELLNDPELEPLEEEPEQEEIDYKALELEHARKLREAKKRQEESEMEQVSKFNAVLETLLDPKYNFKDDAVCKKIQDIIHTEGQFVASTIPDRKHKVYLKILQNNKLTKEIKDKNFQTYLATRKTLEDILIRINNSNNPKYNYLLPVLNKQIKELDEYLMLYISELTFRSNRESIVSYIKSKLRKK